MKRKIKDYQCCLCGLHTNNARHAYRDLREKTVNSDGFNPRNKFCYEEISKMVAGTFNAVCANRRGCLERQIGA